MKVSKSLIKALEILKDTNAENGVSAAGFAEKMWPENAMHRKHSKGGYGIQLGKAGWLCGGSYLGKLTKKGFVSKLNRGYCISQAGRELLSKNQNVSQGQDQTSAEGQQG